MPPRLPRSITALALSAAAGLIASCSESDLPDDELDPARGHAVPRIVAASEAIAGANVPTLDPHTMNGAEIRKALGAEPRCIFRYTAHGRPVIGLGSAADIDLERAVIKLNGDLVVLAVEAIGGRIRLTDEPIQITISLVDPTEENEIGDREAEALLEIGTELRAGYRGYYTCGP